MQRPPEIVIEKYDGYRTIIVNGFFGGHRPGFFEAVIYTDELLTDEALSIFPPDNTKIKIKRTLQSRLVFDPVQAKALSQWLTDHIGKYEKMFGEIPDPSKHPKQQKGKDSTIYT